MFQNISKDFHEDENLNEDVKLYKREEVKTALKRIFAKENIFMYVICFLISMVKFRLDSNISLSVFSIAILAACMSNGIPIGVIYLLCGVRNIYWNGKKCVIFISSNKFSTISQRIHN